MGAGLLDRADFRRIQSSLENSENFTAVCRVHVLVGFGFRGKGPRTYGTDCDDGSGVPAAFALAH